MHLLDEISLLAKVTVAVSLALAVAGSAQTPAFDVVSVRQNRSGNPGSRIGVTEGRFSATNVSLRQLIQEAYRIQSFQLAGGPVWLGTSQGPKRSGDTLFDVVGTVPANSPAAQIPLMVRTLLAERFNLAAHMETRDMPIYALVLARSDKKPGLQLSASTQECKDIAERGPLRAPATRIGADGRPSCGMSISPAAMRAGGVTIAQLANALSVSVQRIVVDRTGLAGLFDFDLRYSAEGRGAPPTGVPQNDAPSIFTAVQEQLGLKLEPTRGPVDVLVLDNATLPTEN